jgi:hypothetical protein
LRFLMTVHLPSNWYGAVLALSSRVRFRRHRACIDELEVGRTDNHVPGLDRPTYAVESAAYHAYAGLTSGLTQAGCVCSEA